MGIPSFLIKYCNASAPAYYDSNWFVTRTRHSRSNLLNRIFITRGRRTVYSSSAWLTKETVHPLPSHYNKNKHSLRGFIYASGAMLILYQFIEISSFYFDVFGFPIDRLSVRCSWRRRYCVPQRSCFFKNCSSAWLALISLDLLISSLSVIIAVNNQRYNCKSNKRIYIVLIIYKNVPIRCTKFRSIFCIFCRLTNYCYSWYAVNK